MQISILIEFEKYRFIAHLKNLWIDFNVKSYEY